MPERAAKPELPIARKITSGTQSREVQRKFPSEVSQFPRLGFTRILKVVILTAGVLFLSLIFALSRPRHDFIEYWTASHLLLSRANPYSLPEMFKAQRALGWDEPIPVMFVCPPWVLPLIAPLGLASSYSLAWVAWMLVLVISLAAASRLLMDVYFAELRIPEVSDSTFYRCLFAFTFYPVLLCLRFAQTAPFLLLGLAGFLHFVKKERPIAAGMMLALTSIKPQLLFLVWIAVILDAFRRGRWRLLVASTGVILAASSLAFVLDPDALQQYRDLVRTPYLLSNPSGITALIRRLLGPDRLLETYWLQFVPPVIGIVWLFFYWQRHKTAWDWTERMPMLVTISVLTSAYGWVFDQTVLVLVVIALAARYARPEGRIPGRLVVWYTVLNGALMLLLAVPPLTYIPAPLFLLGLLVHEARQHTP